MSFWEVVNDDEGTLSRCKVSGGYIYKIDFQSVDGNPSITFVPDLNSNWEVETALSSEQYKNLLASDWEPFCKEDGIMWFKKQK